jgi:hypothetical protein
MSGWLITCIVLLMLTRNSCHVQVHKSTRVSAARDADMNIACYPSDWSLSPHKLCGFFFLW